MKAQRVRSYWEEAWHDPVSLLGQMAPAPGSQFRSSSPFEQSGWRVPGLKCRERGRAEHWEGAQAGGVLPEQPGPWEPGWEDLELAETAAFPQAGLLTGSSVSQQGYGGRWLLFQS